MGIITRTIYECDLCKRQCETRMYRLEDYLIKLFPGLDSINIYDYIPSDVLCSTDCFRTYIQTLIGEKV